MNRLQWVDLMKQLQHRIKCYKLDLTDDATHVRENAIHELPKYEKLLAQHRASYPQVKK